MMEKFTDVLINEFHNAVKSFIVGRIDLRIVPPNKIGDLKNKNINEVNLKHYLEFLDEIPSNFYKEISHKIWQFILMLEIQNNLMLKDSKIIGDRRGKGDPNKIIKYDLAKLNKAKEVFEKVFQTHSKGTHILGYTENANNKKRINELKYSETNSVYNKEIYNIDNLFDIIDLVINDLETKEFKFIGQNIYYQYDSKQSDIKLQTESNFKEYLLHLCKKNKINKYNDNINEFFSEIYPKNDY